MGKLSVGDQLRVNYMIFRNLDDFESYINAIDEGYESEAAIFIGYI